MLWSGATLATLRSLMGRSHELALDANSGSIEEHLVLSGFSATSVVVSSRNPYKHSGWQGMLLPSS